MVVVLNSIRGYNSKRSIIELITLNLGTQYHGCFALLEAPKKLSIVVACCVETTGGCLLSYYQFDQPVRESVSEGISNQQKLI